MPTLPPRTVTVGHPLPSPASKHQSRIAISIVTNSQLFCEGLHLLLQAHLEVSLLGRYAGDFPVSAALPNPPGHVVLIDSNVGGEVTLTCVTQWHNLATPALVLVLEMQNNIDTILTCIEAGANGYTLQGASVLEVAQSIKHVSQGMAHCSPEVTAHLFTRLAQRKTNQIYEPVIPLTQRELEVLKQVALDYSDKEIARALLIEVRTVKHHIHNILQKLKLKHRWDAARLATNRGWLEPTAVQHRPERYFETLS